MSQSVRLLALLLSSLSMMGLTLYLYFFDKSKRARQGLSAQPHQHKPQNENYYRRQRLQGSLLFFLSLVGQIGLWMVYYHQHTWNCIQTFFKAKAHPLNLALFRITLFGLLLKPTRRGLIKYSRIPQDLKIAPRGLGWLLYALPLTETRLKRATHLFRFFCLTGLLGLWTRFSALMTTLLGFYLLGVPHLFGKVNHNHHFLWFFALLAVSPAGDALALDAMRVAERQARHGPPALARPDQAYALPLRFIWLLFGVIYFFPGFWKMRHGGLDWALSDNLRHLVLKKKLEKFGWYPQLDLVQRPLLAKFGGLLTLIFETGFSFLIFIPCLRPLVALGGFMFHKLTELTLGIGFVTLRNLYFVFFNWHRVFTTLGRYFWPSGFTLTYRRDHLLSRWLMVIMKTFDIFEQIKVVEGTTHTVPALSPPPPKSLIAISTVGVGLLLGNIYFGCRKITNSWPLACYPPFSGLAEETVDTLKVVPLNHKGEVISFDENKLSQTISASRYLISKQAAEYQETRLRSLWIWWAQEEPALQEAVRVQFYRETLNILPEGVAQNPLKRELLFELELA